MTTRARAARVDLTVSTNGLDAGLRDARRSLRAFAKDGRRELGALDDYVSRDDKFLRRFGAIGRRAGRGALAGGRAALGAAATGGKYAAGLAGIGIGVVAADVYDVEKALTRFQIATDASPQKMAAFRTELARIGRESGVARDQLVAGAAAYVALTGDADGAARSVELFARVSNATGASMGDIAATAAAMRDNLRIDPRDFEAAFSALHVQGKAGAVELRELATQLAGVAPSFAAFKGGAGAAGLVEMGAALQVIRKGFGSSAEAATGMRSLMVAINRNAEKFRKAGVRIYDKDPKTGKKTLRDFSDIVDAIGKSRLARDPTLLTKAFGSDEAKRAYDQLIANRALFDELIAKSSDVGAVNRDAMAYLASPAGRIAKAWEGIKLSLVEAFTPERIDKFASALERAVVFAADLVDLVDDILSLADSSSMAAYADRTAKFAEAGWSGATAPMAMSTATSAAANLARDFALGGVAPMGEDAMMRALFRGGDQSPQAFLQLQEIAKREVLQGVPREEAVRQVTGGDAALRQMQAAVDRMSMQLRVDVKVGADTVAKVQANAPAHRARPGGM